jgi:hypothetical protein
LRFFVSRDEEHVELQLVQDERVIDLGARNHNFVLLTLARRRLADVADGVPETSCGWVLADELACGLKIMRGGLNLDVFRIRRMALSHGISDGEAIIQRRVGTGQLRVGTGRLAISPL